jgi:hypothetical protein
MKKKLNNNMGSYGVPFGSVVLYEAPVPALPLSLLDFKDINKYKHLILFLKLFHKELKLNNTAIFYGEQKKKLIAFESISGIYLWFNLVNGKYYIGSSVNLYSRLKAYYKKSSNMVIYRAISAYGHSNFVVIILYTFPLNKEFDNKLLLKKEQYYLDVLKPPYNVAQFAGNTLGVKKSLESRQKLSESLKNNKFALNMVHTQETKQKLSDIHMNKIVN